MAKSNVINKIYRAYDAWGKVLSVAGSLASTVGQINPFRYRGYYYDTETGFYYLQTRYYDPEVGRFINADGIIGANGGIQGYNMFAYCNNSTNKYADPDGQDAIILCSTDGVGHLGMLIQDDEGIWWHYYWGTPKSNYLLAVFNVDVAAETWYKRYEGELDLNSINESGQYSGKYHKMLYLKGDFSAGVDQLLPKQEYLLYNLYKNNCCHLF